MNRRLEDRIRQLCTQVAVTPGTLEWNESLHQLKTALHEHRQRMQKLIAELPSRSERRSAG